MQKKGQVTAFIIIGIVALIIIGALFYFRSYKYSGEYTPPNMEETRKYVTACLKDTAEGALLLAGFQGGVIYFGDVLPNIETSYSYSTYWYDSGIDSSVSTDFMENEIRRYIEEEMDSRCIKNFEALHQKLSAGNISADVKINPSGVDVSLNYPVTLTEGDKTSTISQFSVQVPARVSEAVDIANKIVQMEIKDPDNIYISELGDQDLMVSSYSYSDDIILYSIIDEQNKVQGINYKLIFANKFGTESSGNRAPKILNPNNLLLVEGTDTTYQFVAFDADEDRLTWTSTGMDIVDSKGMLRFKPTADDVGERSIDIIVEDGKGGRDSQAIKILVVGQ
jgi:hypothetical protein